MSFISDDPTRDAVTGQEHIDSDDVGLRVAVDLVNDLAVTRPHNPAAQIRRLLAVDPPSLARYTDADTPLLFALAERLRSVCLALDAGDVDAAASCVNQLLAEHSAHPHLALEDGAWRLHHHPVDADVVAMWTAISADAFARLIGEQRHDRLGVCAAPDCDRVYVDTSKNRTRRFCSVTCQNRVKSAEFRRRQRAT